MTEENYSYSERSFRKGTVCMKKLLILIIAIVSLAFSGCISKPYTFSETIDEIESVEIVSAENSCEFTVIKTLSEEEKSVFIEKIQQIEFGRYIIGDPMSVYGDAFKITYRGGDYEMICPLWSEYVKNDATYFRWRFCDEDDFNELLNSFLE